MNFVGRRWRRRWRIPALVAAGALVVMAGCGGTGAGGGDTTTAGGSSATGPGGPAGSEAPATSSLGSGDWKPMRVPTATASVVVACKGQGDPTVLLLNPVATSAADAWVNTPVPEALARRNQVCVYDRPGLGQSAAVPGIPTVADDVAQLDAIVGSDPVGPRVVLVGEGYSTFAARVFARDHLDKTAGLVLIDPPLWPVSTSVSPAMTEGQRAEIESEADINTDIARYGPAALALPPVPVLVVGVDADRPVRPPETPGSPADTAPVVGTTVGSAPEPSTSQRHQSQRELAQRAPFAKFQSVEGSGQWIQAWVPAQTVSLLTKFLDNPDLMS